MFSLMCLVMKRKHYAVFVTEERSFEKHARLLLISNVKNSHYVLIEDFNMFRSSK